MQCVILLVFGTCSVLAFQPPVWRRFRPYVGIMSERESHVINLQAPATVETESSAASSAVTRESWEKTFQTAAEASYALPGEVPLNLEGTLYRNGPGKMDINGTAIRHPLDGDGLMSAITFSNGKAFFRSRYVKTLGWQKESTLRRPQYNGAYATQPAVTVLGNFHDVRVKNAANMNALYWGGYLLALWSGGMPHLMTADNLNTVGVSRLGGVLPAGGSGGTLCARTWVEPATDRLIAFGAQPGAFGTGVKVYEFDSAFKQVAQRDLKLPGYGYYQDFALTANFYVFLQAPLRCNLLKAAAGGADCHSWDEKGSTVVHLVPRDPSQPVQSINLDRFFPTHMANAFEDASGGVVIDMTRIDRPAMASPSTSSDVPLYSQVDFGQDVPVSSLWRYTVSVAAGTYSKTCLSERHCDMPRVSPQTASQASRYIYAQLGASESGASPMQGVLKLDTETGNTQIWQPSPDELCSEILFVPKKDATPDAAEDDGYLLTTIFSGTNQSSAVAVLDASDISKGPIVLLPTNDIIPHARSGQWAPDLVFEEDQMLVKKNLKDIFAEKQWNKIDSKFAGIGISYSDF